MSDKSGKDGLPQIPKGWTWRRVDDLAARVDRAITDGPFGSNLKTAHYTDSGPRVIRLQNIGDGEFIDAEAHIAQAHFERLRAHEAKPGDVVVASLGETLPRACLVPDDLGPAIVKADCPRIRVGDDVRAEFLCAALNSPPVRKQAATLIAGIGRPRLNLGKLRELRIPTPPLAEQDRIVATLERRERELAVGGETVRSLGRLLRALRRSALERAVAGPWPRRPLKDALIHLRNGVFVSRPGPSPPGLAIFRISAVRPMALDVEDVRYAPSDTNGNEGFLVQPDDLLFTRYSGNPEYVGACARVPVLPRPTLHPDKLIRAVVDRSIAEPAFIELACSAGETLHEIRSRRKTTAGQVGIAGGALKEVLIPIPPLDRQREIMSYAQGVIAGVAEAERELARTAALEGPLKASLLQHAVTGRLVPQNPSEERASERLRNGRVDAGAASHRSEGIAQ